LDFYFTFRKQTACVKDNVRKGGRAHVKDAAQKTIEEISSLLNSILEGKEEDDPNYQGKCAKT
jgi:hypothetical protein